MTRSSPLSAASLPYLDDLYARWRDDPASVDPSWRCVFELTRDLRDEPAAGRTGTDEAALAALASDLFRQRGHLAASLDPLGAAPDPRDEAALRDHFLRLGLDPDRWPQLRASYCGGLAVETAHIDDAAVLRWIDAALEPMRAPPDADTLREAHRRLVQADEFERFLDKRFPGKKRFGAEGAETFLVAMERLLRQAAIAGVEHVVIGGMHRGRMSMMANLLGKPLADLLAEFKGAHPFAGRDDHAADVAYHLGVTSRIEIAGHSLSIRMLPNPSHLEAIDPVALGLARALQDTIAATAPAKVLPILLHTDAAVVGQGVVAETLQLAGLQAFGTLGTVHLVIDNRLGFTTEPHEARTSRHCTGPWKAIDSLIVHANSDDVPAVVRAADLALAFRQAQARDSVIDLVCYRRNGHNEIDEPRFTQPLLYDGVDARPGIRDAFEAGLVARGVIDEAYARDLAAACRRWLDDSYRAAQHRLSQPAPRPATPDVIGPGDPTLDATLEDARGSAGTFADAGGPATGIPAARIDELLRQIATVPAGVALGPKLARLVAERARTERGIPWAVAEALAFGSLVTDGVAVRITGQDVVRGAFSHRHFALVDVRSGKRSLTLDRLGAAQARFTAANSPLSEYAVLGFEYGVSLGRPDALVIWEAQFGDFANGAQIVLDQFVAAGEQKWLQPSSLTILLPHGLEGQGPEHSSARIERLLLLAARDNLRIANPSTPANYFHLLRRQALHPVRKPLLVIAPKTLLRLPAAVSDPAEFGPDVRWQPLLRTGAAADARRVLLCSGKIAYDLERERQRRGAGDVAVARVEQLYPLPAASLARMLSVSPRAGLVWVQEEPGNMGAWSWIDRRLEAVARAAGCAFPRVAYCGRRETPSPAGSFHGRHDDDQAAIVTAAFD